MRISCSIAAVLTTTALIAGVGAAGAGDAAAPRHVMAGCAAGDSALTQSMDGRISGCVRLGPLPAGPRTLVVEQILDDEPAAAIPPPKRPAPPAPRPPSPLRAPTEPAIAVSLSPASGAPGTVVTLTGRLRHPVGARRFTYPDLCWGGCLHGLTYGGVAVRWLSPRVFRARLTVPAAPWLVSGTSRLAPLVSGRYAIAVQCLRTAKGCAGLTEGAAIFTLRDAHQPGWCRTPASCARLRVTPSRALPGQVVHVSGFAPLTSVGGGNQPFVDETATFRGHAPGPQVRVALSHGLDVATYGRAPFTVLAPPRYDELQGMTPIGEVADGLTPIAADPAAPSVVAWCEGATIALSDRGATTTVPTGGVGSVLKQMGFRLLTPRPQCAAVAPIDGADGTPVGLAAAFSVGLPPGVPPAYAAAVVTHDNGRNWAPVPVPPGSTAAAFGGFRYRGPRVEAVFGTVAPSKGPYPDIDAIDARAELTTADGSGWTAMSMGCPPAGPCVTLAPFAPGNCAMNGSQQPLVRSINGGRRWSELGFPPWVQSCGQATLVALSARSELLVDSTSEFPVLHTTDGGATWRDIALPPRGGEGDLTVLPDDSLVMSRGIQYIGRWKLLRRGTRRWCALKTPSAAVERRIQLSAPAVIDGELWWLSASAAKSDSAPVAEHVALGALSC